MNSKVAIIGSGHLGQQIAYHIGTDTQDKVVGFYDDFRVKGEQEMGFSILGQIDDIKADYNSKLFDKILIAVGYKHQQFKQQLFEKLSGEIPFYRFVHSTCHIDQSVVLGEGIVIYPGCILDQHVEIGNNTLLNLGCTIAHDSKIGDHCFLSPRVCVAGFVTIGSLSFLGINSTIIDNIYLSSETRTGGGTVVIKNIETKGLYVGNPAKFIR